MKSTKPNYTITRETHKIDATDKPIGRLATEVATLLRGKHKVTFTPHVDNGDFVVIKNAGAAKFTGKKLIQKVYHHHSGHPGGLKTVKASELKTSNPSQLISHAVYKMLPKNKFRSEMHKRLTIKN